jgi:hypothetical protein
MRLLPRTISAMWNAFIDGYRSIRSIATAEFDALHSIRADTDTFG